MFDTLLIKCVPMVRGVPEQGPEPLHAMADFGVRAHRLTRLTTGESVGRKPTGKRESPGWPEQGYVGNQNRRAVRRGAGIVGQKPPNGPLRASFCAI
jgi:hypothetical protein